MSKLLQDKQHTGKCGHCFSEVPLEATVCASCGARWGTSRGVTRQNIYDEGRAKFIVCSITCLFILLSYLVTAYLRSPWILAPMVLAFFPGVPALGMAIGGILTMRGAKRAEVTWWRETGN